MKRQVDYTWRWLNSWPLPVYTTAPSPRLAERGIELSPVEPTGLSRASQRPTTTKSSTTAKQPGLTRTPSVHRHIVCP